MSANERRIQRMIERLLTAKSLLRLAGVLTQREGDRIVQRIGKWIDKQ